ncbi:unnamed protein product [Prorocentrum cordatum]|uniref:VWFA domain-containing protein n=1 Tax=Prorocentrum cordatum TaxID=2364126 RepID=A0ABN9PI57_9DINO|nr:unnamed protein product [Polarella glacialis]
MMPTRALPLIACVLASARGATFDSEGFDSFDTETMQLSMGKRPRPQARQILRHLGSTPSPNGTNESCLNETIPWLQIGFAMDCTGSTGAYLEALKTTVYNLAVDFNASVNFLQMAFLCYRDEGDVSPPRYEWAVHPTPGEHWFSDPDALQLAIAPFISLGGGDSPEDNAGAMGEMKNEKPWDVSAVKIMMVISKDRDSYRTPYQTDALQCQLMQDIRAANITLVLGHLDTSTTSSMLWDSTYKPTLPWRGCYADPSDPHQLKEIQFMGATASEFSALLIEEICDTLSSDPGVGHDVGGHGDPHLVNMHGERFDIMRPGRYSLLHIPLKADKKDVLLSARADVLRIGTACGDMYFTSINITGQWARGHKNTSFIAGAAPPRTTTGWVRYGHRVSLKVVHGLTGSGTRYLNIFAKDVHRAGHKVGGLLGADDHTKASTEETGCQKLMAL